MSDFGKNDIALLGGRRGVRRRGAIAGRGSVGVGTSRGEVGAMMLAKRKPSSPIRHSRAGMIAMIIAQIHAGRRVVRPVVGFAPGNVRTTGRAGRAVVAVTAVIARRYVYRRCIQTGSEAKAESKSREEAMVVVVMMMVEEPGEEAVVMMVMKLSELQTGGLPLRAKSIVRPQLLDRVRYRIEQIPVAGRRSSCV